MNDGTGFQKRRQLLEMLDRGLVMLHLDPRAPEVIVPARFKSDPVLRLNLAYQFRLPALDIGAEGVYAVLSFDKQNFGCTLPWSSIFAVTRPDAGHDGVIWPESVPPELRASLSRAGVEAPTRMRKATPPEGTPTQRSEAMPESTAASESTATSESIASPSESTAAPLSSTDSAPETAAAGAGPERRRGHLKLVKG